MGYVRTYVRICTIPTQLFPRLFLMDFTLALPGHAVVAPKVWIVCVLPPGQEGGDGWGVLANDTGLLEVKNVRCVKSAALPKQ